jgi:hypothetical protein
LKQNPPPELRASGLAVLASLISYASHYGDLALPMQFYGHLQKTKAKELSESENKMTFIDVRKLYVVHI